MTTSISSEAKELWNGYMNKEKCREDIKVVIMIDYAKLTNRQTNNVYCID